MGPQEKRLTGELAMHLVRSCSRALMDQPPGETLDLDTCRHLFEQAYREWQLTPRVDLAGRAPYEVITAERAAMKARSHRTLSSPEPAVELYADLPGAGFEDQSEGEPAAGRSADTTDVTVPADPPAHASPALDPAPGGHPRVTGAWQRLAEFLFGPRREEE